MKSMNTKNTGLAVAALVMLVGMAFLAPNSASAQDGNGAAQVQPIFESEKAWKFKDNRLVFFNPSPNPDGTRFLRWKEYTWVVTADQIIVVDPRPYGTQVQGKRFQMTEKGPQKDKDLMKDLKEQAEDIREAKDPNHRSLPVSIGLGLGFRF